MKTGVALGSRSRRERGPDSLTTSTRIARRPLVDRIRHEAVPEVVEGQTDVFLLDGGREVKQTVGEGELIVVPQNTWHRFETAGVKILTVTPAPLSSSSQASHLSSGSNIPGPPHMRV